MSRDFSSDNTTGIAPEILAAITACNSDAAPPYGNDEASQRLQHRLAEVFEHELVAFPVSTGTAANALALSCIAPAWGAIYCHEGAHVANDEANAPEFFSGGAKLVPLSGADGKLVPSTLAEKLASNRGDVHRAAPSAVSISQSTEAGTVYRPEDIRALASLAHQKGMKLHMDGARFANAVASLGVTPAEMTWRAGVDVLSLGATKNGALAAEAVIFFDPLLACEMPNRRKRAGHLLSKHRFIAAQLDAYFHDGLWLTNAAKANESARYLAQKLSRVPGATLRYPVEANEIFIELPEPVICGLLELGYRFYRWNARTIRLVTSFETEAQAVEALIKDAERLSQA